jgi:23S rRNA (uracil1939-C5)-methyltransferase
MGDRVRAHAIRELGDVVGRHVWDLYAGIGEASVRLSEGGASVESVEVEPDAVAFAEREGPSRTIRRHVGRVEEWVTRLQQPAKVLTNPPRAGMDQGVVAAIAAARPETVVYVSCDPATLGRDLGRLKAGYRVASVTAFDLFPQTAHVETVVRLDQA